MQICMHIKTQIIEFQQLTKQGLNSVQSLLAIKNRMLLIRNLSFCEMANISHERKK